MAPTLISDIIQPEIWADYEQEITAENSAFFQSPVIRQAPQLDALVTGAGQTFNIPFFQDLSGDSEVCSDTTPAVANKIDTDLDVGFRYLRQKLWGASDLAGVLSGTGEIIDRIGQLTGAYWAREFNKILINQLNGIFANALASTHVNDISIEDGNAAVAAQKWSADAFIDTLAKLGDMMEGIAGVAVHSVVYANMKKQNLISFRSISEQNVEIPYYLDKYAVIHTDTMPRVAGNTSGFKYTSYLFGAGSVLFGSGVPANFVPLETDRDITLGLDYLMNRRAFMFHIPGVKWTGTIAGAAPTNAEAATGGNYSRVYEAKNIKVLKLVTNG